MWKTSVTCDTIGESPVENRGLIHGACGKLGCAIMEG